MQQISLLLWSLVATVLGVVSVGRVGGGTSAPPSGPEGDRREPTCAGVDEARPAESGPETGTDKLEFERENHTIFL